MSRFFVPKGSILGGRINVKGEELHHARDVMRLKAGDKITVFDGSGKEYSGTVDNVGKDGMSASVNKVTDPVPDRCRLTLIQAVPKSSKMDIIIEKATEIGVSRIIPVITGRTVVKVSGEGNKLERWRKIAVVAAKQSGRTTCPEISPAIDFRNSISQIKEHKISIIPCLFEGNVGIKEALKHENADSAAVFIGPEGDFTKEEVALAVNAGAIPVILGREVLRSETAAIAVLSVLSYELRW